MRETLAGDISLALDIVVISLPGATRRRANVEEQFSAAGLPFRYFDALTGEQAMERELFESVDEEDFVLNCGRRVVPGEIGCFASHRALWEDCMATGRSMLIMEDDFSLRDNFPAAVAAAGALIERAGFIRLQTDLRARKKPVVEAGEFTLARFTKPPHGLMCYAISPAVAGEFVAQTTVLDAPVDVFVKKYWEHGQQLYALLPYSVGESRLHQSTSIDGRRRHAKPFDVAARRFLRRARWQLRRSWWNLVRAADDGLRKR